MATVTVLNEPKLHQQKACAERAEAPAKENREFNMAWGIVWVIGLAAGWMGFFLVLQKVVNHLIGR